MASTQEVEMMRRQLDELTAQMIEMRQQSSKHCDERSGDRTHGSREKNATVGVETVLYGPFLAPGRRTPDTAGNRTPDTGHRRTPDTEINPLIPLLGREALQSHSPYSSRAGSRPRSLPSFRPSPHPWVGGLGGWRRPCVASPPLTTHDNNF